MRNKIERMGKVERKRMVKGKQWMVLSTVAMALGVVAFGGTEASAAEYTAATWEARMPNEIQILDRSNYLIEWGDTLWAISEASDVSVDALVEINNIANRDLIYAGNTLVIEGNKVTVTEQNGTKSSYVVEGNSVTETNDHVVAVETPAPKPVVAEENVATDKETPAKPVEGSVDVDKEDGGNFEFVGNDDQDDAEDVPAVEQPADENPVEDAPVVDVEDEDEGGNFEPALPVEEDNNDGDVEEEDDTPVVEDEDEGVVDEDEEIVEEDEEDIEEEIDEDGSYDEAYAAMNAQRVEALDEYLRANVSPAIMVFDTYAPEDTSYDFAVVADQNDFPDRDVDLYLEARNAVQAYLDGQGISYDEYFYPGSFQFNAKF